MWVLLGWVFWPSVRVIAQNKTLKVNVKSFGAKGDGKANDTQSLLHAFRQVAKSGGNVYFPAGTYLTDVLDIRPLPGVSIIVTGDNKKTLIKKNSNDKTNVALFFCEIKGVNLTFRDLFLDGSASSRRGKWHTADRNGVVIDEEIDGIYTYNLSSLIVSSCRIQNFHGKGVAAYNCDRFIAENNIISNVNGSAIQGHRVAEMRVINNVINNTGFVSANDLVDDKSGQHPATLFGDGVEAECNTLVATGNHITNPGRCGIVHDLAKDLGYKNSSATVSHNTVIVNSRTINNNNPPAGMWFEQSANVVATHNRIIFQNSSSKFVSGIRFYDITNQIYCGYNVIDAGSYNLISDAGIGIYEPALKVINLQGNTITGKFSKCVVLAYGHAPSKVEQFLVDGNRFLPDNKQDVGLEISVGGHCDFPGRNILKNNEFFLKADKMYKFSYYGIFPVKRQVKSVMSFANNKNMGMINHTRPSSIQGVVFAK